MEGFSVVFDSNEDAAQFMQTLCADIETDRQRGQHVGRKIAASSRASKPKPTVPVFESRADINGRPDETLSWRYVDSGFDVSAFVERDTMIATQSARTGAFVGEIAWSSRGRVTLDDAEAFALSILDAVKRARDAVAIGNAPSTPV